MHGGSEFGARPRLLYLCQQNPWRLAGGGLIRNYWVARALAERFDVDLVTADDLTPPPLEFARRFRSIRCFPRRRGSVGRVVRSLEALRPGASLSTSGTVGAVLRAHVARTAVTAAYRGVVYDFNMLEALPRGVPQVYHAHNCETMLLRRRVGVETGAVKFGVALDAWRVARIERRTLLAARLVIACSKDDACDLASLAPTVPRRAAIAPNGVDVATYARVRESRGEPYVVAITGSFDWRPNALGLAWFLREVLPGLRAAPGGEALEFRVAGRMSVAFARDLARHPGVTAVRNPRRMDDELARASVVVAPIVASSGTRVRILEAWAARRPVVTTDEGAFGLRYTPERDLIVRTWHDPGAFGQAIRALLDDGPRADAIAAAGYARALAHDWRGLAAGLVDAVEEALLSGS